MRQRMETDGKARRQGKKKQRKNHQGRYKRVSPRLFLVELTEHSQQKSVDQIGQTAEKDAYSQSRRRCQAKQESWGGQGREGRGRGKEFQEDGKKKDVVTTGIGGDLLLEKGKRKEHLGVC